MSAARLAELRAKLAAREHHSEYRDSVKVTREEITKLAEAGSDG